MLNIIAGGAGTGKTYEMMNRIEAAIKEDREIIVIIPDQFSFEFDRDLYERLGAVLFNKIDVLSFKRLSRDIFIKHGGIKGKYADDTVKNILMFRTVNELAARKELVFYNKQAAQPSFIESCLEIVKELTVNGISPEQFAKTVNGINSAGSAECDERSDKTIREKVADISAVFTEYSRMLAEKGYKDGEGDIAEAAEKAAASGYFRNKTVFVDAFKSFTADEYAMLNAVLAYCDDLTLCLTSEEDQRTGYSVFETVNKTIDKLRRSAADHGVKVNIEYLKEYHRFNAEELAFYSRNVFRNIGDKKFGKQCKALQIYDSPDIYGEGDFVCSEIRRLVMEENIRYSDIAVLCRKKDTYSSVMESSFERYGIPFYTDENYSASHKSLFVFVKTALKLAADKNASVEDWLRYMKTGIPGISDRDIAAIEEYCYKWNVTGKMWNEPFIADNGSYAEKVRVRVTEPVTYLREACADADGKQICRAILVFFEKTRTEKNICDIYDSCPADDADALSAVRELRQLWELLCSLLETLGRTLEDTKISLKDFSELFSSAVGRLKISSPPQTLDCVTFAAVHTARLSNVKAVFVIGANEGIFPYAAKTSGLLSDRDRSALEEAGLKLSGNVSDKIAEERFAAYSALSAASDRLYLSYAGTDTSGTALYPSRAVVQANDMFGDYIVTSFEKRGLLSFCTTPEAAYYQYVQNYRRGDSDSESLSEALDRIPEFSLRMEYLRNVGSAAEHRLSAGMGKRLFGKEMHLSASRFEDYNKCPFMYYCKKGLKIYAPRKIDMDSPSKGTAIHYCLAEFLKSFNKDKFIAMDKKQISSEVRKRLDDYYNSSLCGDFGKTKRFKAMFWRLSDTVTDILSRLADEFRQNEFVPDSFEYSIGRTDGDEPLKLVTDGGITVYFDGSVDRVDVYTSGDKKYIRVIDYKSGSKEFSFNDLLYGINMQMLLYLFALTESANNGRYKDCMPAGVLYMPAKDADPALKRHEGDEKKEIVMRDTFKMKGAVLCDADVISAMEKDIGGNFIPVRKSKDGYMPYSKLITENQFENLRKYSYELLKETAVKLDEGHIEAIPLKSEAGYLPCSYCDYYPVCGAYPPQTVRTYAGNANEQINKIMDGKEN